MDIETLFELYKKEREYQKCCFGDYKEIASLNLASFLQFIEEYLKRCKKEYSGKWSQELPNWLKTSIEMEQGGSSPANAYEELIKVFALVGAAIETYADIDPEEWRKDPEEKIKKWIE